jgi:hypothetical protein
MIPGFPQPASRGASGSVPSRGLAELAIAQKSLAACHFSTEILSRFC